MKEMAIIANLESGRRYVFHTKPWESPEGEVIPGVAKERTFVGIRNIGPGGLPTIPFIEVTRDDGSQHLIAVETIERILICSNNEEK